MYEEKKSTRILRTLMSVRDSLDRIEYGKPASFHEINRLESLDEVLSALLLNYLKEELSK
tara:strand:- start:68 stop:247 length:180 start_codon:yes stop_codon:yes gene_type:complete